MSEGKICDLENVLICITGPTASGKTALSIALAKQRHTEIISADSMQLYSGMDIGTAKPTLAERQGVVHHMFDVCEPTESFSVACYVTAADQCAQTLLARGMTPIVVGGTGLYLDALIECSTFSGSEVDHALRAHYEQMAREKGNQAVHDALRAVDPHGAARLHPNNIKRVIRALEVYHQTGMTLDALNARNKRPAPKYRAIKLGLCPSSRDILYARIDRRVEQMLEQGLADEVRGLYERHLLGPTAAQAIGYKEFLPWLMGQTSLESCVELLKQRSRNYAKRQLTWLRRDQTIHWLLYDSADEFAHLLQRSTEILMRERV